MGVQMRADSAGVQGLVGDLAAFPKGKAAGVKGVHLPPYSPELNPAERVFAEVRRWIEGEELWEHRGEVGGCGEFFEEL